jgi:hypothetical protein
MLLGLLATLPCMGGSAPWWLVLLVGALGLAGAWGAQVIAGRNESRKWERERLREAQAYWRDRRFAAYSDYLTAVDDALESVKRAAGLSHRPGVETDPSDAHDRVATAFGPLELVGSKQAISAAFHLRFRLLMLHLRMDPDDRTDMSKAEREEEAKGIEARLGELREQFRRDLGISGAD